jgi:hypothetical protein
LALGALTSTTLAEPVPPLPQFKPIVDVIAAKQLSDVQLGAITAGQTVTRPLAVATAIGGPGGSGGSGGAGGTASSPGGVGGSGFSFAGSGGQGGTGQGGNGGSGGVAIAGFGGSGGPGGPGGPAVATAVGVSVVLPSCIGVCSRL